MLRTADEVLAHVARRLPGLRPTGKPERLSGGHLNYVWRVPAQPEALIVKSAPPFVAALPDVPLDPDRILFEARSLALLGPGGRLSALCSDAIRAPTSIDLDAVSKVLVMEDVGVLSDLGEHLRRGKVDDRWGTLLGGFIGALHARTVDDIAVAEDFNNAAVQHTRLTVQYRSVGPLLAAAGIDVPPEVARRAAELGERFTRPGICLIMGDLWPASILVDGGRLRLIDWELAHFGRPAQDVGHLLAHLWMHAHCNRDRSVARRIDAMASAFLAGYVSAAEPAAERLLDAQFVTDCAVHMGAEIIMRALGPFRRGGLYADLPVASKPVRRAVAFAIDSILEGGNALLAPAYR